MFERSTAPLPELPAGAVRITPTLTEESHLVVANRHKLKDDIVEAWERGAIAVHIDLAACGYMDTSAVGVLISALNRGRHHHDRRCHIVIERANEDVRSLFELTAIAPLFRFVP